jgi:hypothetical protein
MYEPRRRAEYVSSFKRLPTAEHETRYARKMIYTPDYYIVIDYISRDLGGMGPRFLSLSCHVTRCDVTRHDVVLT